MAQKKKKDKTYYKVNPHNVHFPCLDCNVSKQKTGLGEMTILILAKRSLPHFGVYVLFLYFMA